MPKNKPETVLQFWNMKCPKCESDESINIDATISCTLTLTHDGTEENDTNYPETNWEEESHAHCSECDFHGHVRDFDADTQD